MLLLFFFSCVPCSVFHKARIEKKSIKVSKTRKKPRKSEKLSHIYIRRSAVATELSVQARGRALALILTHFGLLPQNSQQRNQNYAINAWAKCFAVICPCLTIHIVPARKQKKNVRLKIGIWFALWHIDLDLCVEHDTIMCKNPKCARHSSDRYDLISSDFIVRLLLLLNADIIFFGFVDLSSC